MTPFKTRLLMLATICVAQALFAMQSVPARAQSAGKPMVLVASQRAVESYGETVVLAVPLSNGSHFGFVLNRPSDAAVGALFEGEQAKARAEAPVLLGGPRLSNVLFALVRDPAGDLTALRHVTPELSIALDGEEVDRVISSRPGEARFYMGLVAWEPGELAGELKAGMWHALAPHAGIVMSTQPETLWTRLAPIVHARHS